MDQRASLFSQRRGLSGAWLSAVMALAGCIYKAPIGDDGREDASSDAGHDATQDGGSADATPARPCTNDSQCGAGEQCLGGEGCDVPWTCQAFVGDRVCTADYGPYCGCDGVTIYGSSSCPPGPFAYRGECRGGPPVDAGVDSGPTDAGPPVDAGDAGARACSADRDCPRGYSCSGPEGCGTEWTCQPNAGGADFRACTADYAPFCGCDGVTIYGSSSCPPGRFAYRGECRDGGTPVDAGSDGGAADGGAPDFCPRALCPAGTTCCEASDRCIDPRTETCGSEPAFCPRALCAAGTTCCEAARRCLGPGERCDAPAPCIRTGCSGQICSDEDVGSTCEWRESYACYRTAECKRQADGLCGWTDTTELRACLARSP